MGILDKLERKIGRFAIKGLINYIVGLNLAVYLLGYIDPTGSLTGKLTLNLALVAKGEVWRLITYIFIPPAESILWVLFTLYFYFMIGSNLEREWGSFKFNVYYFIGMLGTTVAALLTGGHSTGTYLNLSLFLAFASLYPNFEILLFLILPVKVKYLAWLNWIFIAYTVLTEPLPLKAAAIVSVINYFVFFGRDMLGGARTKRQVYHNRKKFFDEIRQANKRQK